MVSYPAAPRGANTRTGAVIAGMEDGLLLMILVCACLVVAAALATGVHGWCRIYRCTFDCHAACVCVGRMGVVSCSGRRTKRTRKRACETLCVCLGERDAPTEGESVRARERRQADRERVMLAHNSHARVKERMLRWATKDCVCSVA